ncbi:MAG: hypothetical protein IJS46_04560, partial [Kiritimatiellae bacterium]|nr:hypothetical protein [Kiritimatiellia bacterium]
MKTRRRTARRKFHALHPDFAFVALVAAALAAHVAFHGASPRGKNPVAGAVRAGKAGAATGLAVVFAETAPEALFDPVPRFADLTLPEKTSDASPPRDLALLPPPGSETAALLSPSVAPPDLPASVAKPSFPLSE